MKAEAQTYILGQNEYELNKEQKRKDLKNKAKKKKLKYKKPSFKKDITIPKIYSHFG